MFCVHGNIDSLDPELVFITQQIEKVTGEGIYNSGFRCQKCNEMAGGKPGSAHLRGKALDRHCPTSKEKWILLDALFQFKVKRIVIYPTFIHYDVDYILPQPIVEIKA